MPQSPYFIFIVYGAMFALMYFLLIRPNRKKSQAAQQMRDNLKIGDRIVTIGGFMGKVEKLGDDFITVNFNGTSLSVKKWAVGSVETE